MIDKTGPNWTKIGVMVAIGMAVATMLCTTLNNAPTWVPFLEQRGYDAAWLLPSVRLVQRWWRVVFAGAGLVLVGALLWWFRRQVIRPFKWLGGLGKRFYLWVLWEVVIRPARDHFGVEAHEEADGITPALTDLLRDRLRGLDADSLWVLEGALARRKPGSNEAVLEYPDGMRLEPRESGAGMAKPRFEKALDKLKSVGAISSWEPVGREHTRNFSIRVLLPTADWKTLDRLRVLAEVEWARKSLSAEVWAEEVRDLPPLAASLLHAILYDYSRDPSSHVLMLRSDLKTLAEQLNVDLPEMERACADLKVARFLENFDWRDDDVGIKLDAQLAERVKGEQTVRDLMSAILSRLEAEGEWPWA